MSKDTLLPFSKLTTFIAILGLLCSIPATAQNDPSFFKVLPDQIHNAPQWAQAMYSADPQVLEVVDAYHAFYATNAFEKNIHTQNFKFWLKKVQNYVGANGSIELPSHQEEQALFKTMKKQRYESKKAGAIWQDAGPFDTYENNGSLDLRPTQTNVSCIAVAPSNTDILYSAANTGGGIFKSIDHGLNWLLVSAEYPINDAADIKVHPTDPDIVYAAVGYDVYKSTDGAATWTLVFNASGIVRQFYIYPSQPDSVFAATSSGLYISPNGGTSWNQIMNKPCWDIEPHAIDPSIIYLSTSNSTAKRAEVWKSTNAGAFWTLKDSLWYVPTNVSSASDLGCKIAVTPADPDRVYACLIGNSKADDDGWIGVYYSLNGGDSWVNADGIDGGPYASGNDMNTNWYVAGYSSGYHQGWYNFDMDVSHVDPDRIWIGTIWACESGNRGMNIEYIRGTRSLSMHADVQDIDVVGNEIWYTSDGGINYSNDEMQSVETRNSGLSASTFWGFSSGWNEDVWTGGRYHNGNAVYHANYGNGNTMFLGGAETSTGYIDPMDNRVARFSDIGDKLVPDSLDQSSQNISNLGLYPNESYWILNSSELEWHPNYAQVMYLGKDNILYKSENGGISFDPLYTFSSSSRVLEFEISRLDPTVIYCLVRIGNLGRIYYSNDGGQSFTLTTTVPSSNRAELDLSMDHSDTNTLWVSSRLGSNTSKVFSTDDGGVTWQNRSTSALNGHKIGDILYQDGSNDVVYIATDFAVFYWDAVQSDWVLYSDGLPFNPRPLHFKPFYRDSKLRLATDRGIWEAQMAAPSLPVAEPITRSSAILCARDTVQFEDHSFLDHTNATWTWSFTPPPAYVSSFTTRNPRVLFNVDGDYDVSLAITDSAGNTSSKTIIAMVNLSNDCEPDSTPSLSMICFSDPDHAVTPDLQIAPTNNLSLSAWIKPDAIQNDYTGIIFNEDEGAGMNFRINNELGYHWPGGQWWWSSGHTVPSGEWSHVAMVVTPSAVTLYLNGVASTHNISLSPTQISSMRIGSYQGWGSRNYSGEVDEVCIWDRSLTQNEIRSLRHLTRTGPTPFTSDLVAYYQFNSPGTTILDRVGTKHASLGGLAQKVTSTAPIGGGESHLLNVSSTGSFTFGSTGFTAELGPIIPNGELVATRIDLLPDSLPLFGNPVSSYWVVNNYAVTPFSPANELSFTIPGSTAQGDETSTMLHTRGANEDLNNWVQRCSASSINAGVFSFDVACSITNFSQFFITSGVVADVSDLSSTEDIHLFPNPASNELFIATQKNSSSVFLITDILGNLVIKGSLNKGMINVSELAEGVYLLSLPEEGVVLRFVKG